MEIAVGVLVALLAAGLVAYPVFAAKPADRTFADDAEIRAEVERYRAALKSRTLCDYCLNPNPAGSTYCAECGRAL